MGEGGAAATGMAAFVSTLTSGLSAEALWGAIAPAGALILILTLFALGKRVLNKNIKGANKGTGGKS